MELNERNIREAKVGEVLRDTKISGLHLRVFTKGKGFYLYYRTKAGKERKPKIGDYGSITLTQARAIAQEMLAQVALGNDPSKSRLEARNEPTIEDLWEEYWKRYGSKKKSKGGDLRNWNKHIRPVFGRSKLSEVEYKEVADFHSNLSINSPVSSNRVLALLSKMFSFAYRPLEWTNNNNPVKGVKRNPEKKRRRYMKNDEPIIIANILDREAKDNPASVAFIYLLILTGARKSEIANARWEWIRGNVLSLPDSKTGEKNIYLPPSALEILDRLPKTSGTITGIKSPYKLWVRIREEAGCKDLRLHDLRHSFASSAIEAGLSLAQIGELLGHSTTQTTKRYAHLVDSIATTAATITADKILLAMKKDKN